MDKNSFPETGTKQMAQRFESSKARNILDSLPKTLKKFHFQVLPLPDEIVHKEENKKLAGQAAEGDRLIGGRE